MPFLDPETLSPIGLEPQRPEPVPAPPATMSEMWDAALEDTTLYSTARGAASAFDRSRAPAVPGYDPFDDIEGYESYAESFIDADSPAEVSLVKKKIDAERRMYETLDRGGMAGIAVGLAAQLTDPVNLIPYLGVARRAYSMGRVGRGAIEGAAVATAAAGIQEGVLQATQETRTAEQSALNIAAATVLGGIVGGGTAAISDGALLSAGRELIPDGVDTLKPGWLNLSKADLDADVNSSVGAARSDVSVAGERLKSALGAEKVLKNTSPMLRTAQSASIETRRIVQDLVDTPYRYEKNALGVASPISVETNVRMWQAPLAESVQELDRLFVKYRTGKEGGRVRRLAIQAGDTKRASGTGPLNYKEFKEEVGKAMRRGDFSGIPEIAQAARTFREKLFDPLKERAIANGLLPEDVAVETAESYLSRVWNIDKINARRPDLVDRTVNWLERHHSDLSPEELEDIAQQIIDTLLGTPGGRIPYATVPLKNAGPLKERTFNIPDDEIEDFLESDIETVARFYTRTMAPDVELAEKFGRADMAEQVQKIKDDYAAKQMKVDKTLPERDQEKLRQALADRRNADIRDIQAMRDLIRGTYAAPSDPNSLLTRGVRVVKQWNYMRMLGGMTISALPDLARPVMVEGIYRVAKAGLVPMVTNLKGLRLAAKEVKKAGTALDMVLDSRALALADIADDFGRYSKFERGVDALARNFGTVSIMSPWNATMKQFSGVLVMDRILEHTARWAKVSSSAPEKIHQAAVRIEGDVYTGSTHFEATEAAAKALGVSVDDLFERTGSGVLEIDGDGFVTTSGRYVRRREAAEIAAGADQISPIGERSREESAALVLRTKELLAEQLDDSRLGKMKPKRGRLSESDIETLASQGIDEGMAERIAVQFAKHGETDRGVRIANTDQWDDLVAMRTFRAAVNKATDTIIVTPGVGDRPLMASKFLGSPELASLIFQFKTFAFASMQRVAIAGLQQRDASTLSGALMAMGLGSLVYYLKTKQANKEVSDDPRVWISEGIDRSGLMGWLFDVNNIVEKGTRGTVGVNALVGGPPMSRYASRNVTGAVLGPTLGTMEDFAQGVGAISTGEFGESDRRALRRLAPYQNLFYLRGLFDQVEEGGN